MGLIGRCGGTAGNTALLAPRFEKALGAKRAAKFYQVDNRLSMMINLQLASMVPLIP